MLLVGFIIRMYHDARSPEYQIISVSFCFNCFSIHVVCVKCWRYLFLYIFFIFLVAHYLEVSCIVELSCLLAFSVSIITSCMKGFTG